MPAGSERRCISAGVGLILALLSVTRIGARPTLIERDDNLPEFVELLDERNRADALLRASRRPITQSSVK